VAAAALRRCIWADEERLEFFSWIASEPEAGVVIAGSGGCRKVRWSRPGMGKQGGARVIYFTQLGAGELCMLPVVRLSCQTTDAVKKLSIRARHR